MDACAVVLAGGDPVDAALRSALPDVAFVVAADSGLHLAAPLGLKVDRIVGDLDSADLDLVDAAVADGAVVERHPAAKDATDLELAIDAAVRQGAQRIIVVGGAGGRVDHFVENVLLLASPAWAGVSVEAYFGGARVLVAHGGRPRRVFEGRPGSLVTLLPAGGAARDIVTTGLEYPLAHEDLEPSTSRGVSNLMTGKVASVKVGGGTLLVVQPDAGKGVLS
jgi:thiamine pyrophosphokinase